MMMQSQQSNAQVALNSFNFILPYKNGEKKGKLTKFHISPTKNDLFSAHTFRDLNANNLLHTHSNINDTFSYQLNKKETLSSINGTPSESTMSPVYDDVLSADSYCDPSIENESNFLTFFDEIDTRSMDDSSQLDDIILDSGVCSQNELDSMLGDGDAIDCSDEHRNKSSYCLQSTYNSFEFTHLERQHDSNPYCVDFIEDSYCNFEVENPSITPKVKKKMSNRIAATRYRQKQKVAEASKKSQYQQAELIFHQTQRKLIAKREELDVMISLVKQLE